MARSLSFGNIRFPSLAPKEELEEEAVSPQMLMVRREYVRFVRVDLFPHAKIIPY